MKKTLTVVKLLTIILILPTITQHNTMMVQANQEYLARETMNESEKRIIADIKKAIILLSSKSATLADIASEFGSSAKGNDINAEVKPLNNDLDTIEITNNVGIKPFNNDLDRFEITNNSGIHLSVKENAPIHIEAFKESFGKYISHAPDHNHPTSIAFKTKPLEDDFYYYEIVVTHIGPFMGRNLDESRVLWVDIDKVSKELYGEDK
jgi:hypothetical protein